MFLQLRLVYFLFISIFMFQNEVRSQELDARKYFNLCNIDNENFNECVIKSVNEAKNAFVKGIPEINFPPIEPFVVEKIGYQEGSGRFYLRHNFMNFTILDMKNYEMTKFTSDFSNLSAIRMNLTVKFPTVMIKSKYLMEGQILFLPFYGKGDCYFNMTDCSWEVQLFGQTVTKPDQRQYFDLQKFKLHLTIGRAKFRFDNLFNGNKVLGDATNNFLNSNWKIAFETYRHLPETTFGDFFKSTFSPFFTSFTFDHLFRS